MPKIRVRDRGGGHAEIYYGEKEVGYINYQHNISSVDPLPRKHLYSAFLNIAPEYRGLGIGSQAYKLWAALRKMQGDTVIRGYPLSYRSRKLMRSVGYVEDPTYPMLLTFEEHPNRDVRGSMMRLTLKRLRL